MAKAQGIIGNFKGKVGNMVGYQLTDSNNKQTQGIRIYQPNVKNPKTSAQAEQRAKLAPINATYRALKMIIDRGNEGLPYGNKSRLAWLKQAFKAELMPWFVKGSNPTYPVACQLTKGSLNVFTFNVEEGFVNMNVPGLVAETDVSTVAKLTAALLAQNPALKEGDQLTYVAVQAENDRMMSYVMSIVLDSTDNTALDRFTANENTLQFSAPYDNQFGAIILSREGANGEHLRSTTALVAMNGVSTTAPYDAASKTAAIESYMASGAANTDWAEESIQ